MLPDELRQVPVGFSPANFDKTLARGNGQLSLEEDTRKQSDTWTRLIWWERCAAVPSATAENDMTHLQPVSRVGPAVSNTAGSPRRSHLKQYGPVISVKSHTQEGVFSKSIGFISHMHLLKSLEVAFSTQRPFQNNPAYLVFSLLVFFYLFIYLLIYVFISVT